MSQAKTQSPKSMSSLSRSKPEKTLEEYEESKRKKLENLKKQSKEDKRIFEELGVQTRKQQLNKAKSLTEGNPLSIDQAAKYDRDMTRLRKKYLLGNK